MTLLAVVLNGSDNPKAFGVEKNGHIWDRL